MRLGKPIIPVALGAPLALPALSEITHNRMYVPTFANTLQLSVNVTQGSIGNALEVFFKNSDNSQTYFLGAVDVEQTTSNFSTYSLSVPQGMSGTTGTLEIRLVDQTSNGLYSELLLDNVFFTT